MSLPPPSSSTPPSASSPACSATPTPRDARLRLRQMPMGPLFRLSSSAERATGVPGELTRWGGAARRRRTPCVCKNRLALPAPATGDRGASSGAPPALAPPALRSEPVPEVFSKQKTHSHLTPPGWKSGLDKTLPQRTRPPRPRPPHPRRPRLPRHPRVPLSLCPPECGTPSPESLHSGLALMKSSFWRSQNLCRLHETRHSIQQQSSNKILSYDVPRYKIIP